jgi:hypothetical protein
MSSSWCVEQAWLEAIEDSTGASGRCTPTCTSMAAQDLKFRSQPHSHCAPNNQKKSRKGILMPFIFLLGPQARTKPIRTHGPLYSSSIRPSQQDSLLYTQFFRTHPSSISSSIYFIHCGTHLSLYLNISMCDLVLKDLLRRI